jgi:enoyl-CoA hydratase/carnithine racemase
MTAPHILWPDAHDIAIAPEIGVIALLDAACAASVAYLLAVNHEIASAEDACRADLPPYVARAAATLIARIHSLRASLRDYSEATLHPAVEPVIEPPPF